MCVKAPDYLKDMLVRAKLQFEGFDHDNATQPRKPHRESMRSVFALCHGNTGVYKGIQGYARVSGVYRSLRGYTRVCKGAIYKGIQGFT